MQELLKEKEQRLAQNLPQLMQRYNSSKSEEQATLFKGKKGIKSVFEEILKENKPILVYGAESKFTDMFPAYQKDWNSRRAKLGIKMDIIFNEKVKALKIAEKMKLCRMRFLPKQYDFPSTIILCGNITLTIVWSEMPFAFLIRSAGAAKSQNNFFDLLWKQAK